MEDHNVSYFRNLWKTNVSDLEKQCKSWEKICKNNEIPDEALGEIRTTIGLARLLMNQKLKQFKGLIDDSEFNTGEKEITCSDLQGFWDMVYFEVEKIQKGFLRLDKCKNNEWNFIEENSEKPLQKKVPVVKDAAVPIKKDDSSKSRALAAKQRLAEAKQKMLAQRKQQNEDNFVEINQPNAVKSPNSEKAKQSNKRLKNLDHEKAVNPIETSNDIPKQKAVGQKSQQGSVKNKENVFPAEGTSDLKSVSATLTKSKLKAEAPKSRKKSEIIKLQCITRSMKKAMSAQQNGM